MESYLYMATQPYISPKQLFIYGYTTILLLQNKSGYIWLCGTTYILLYHSIYGFLAVSYTTTSSIPGQYLGIPPQKPTEQAERMRIKHNENF